MVVLQAHSTKLTKPQKPKQRNLSFTETATAHQTGGLGSEPSFCKGPSQNNEQKHKIDKKRRVIVTTTRLRFYIPQANRFAWGKDVVPVVLPYLGSLSRGTIIFLASIHSARTGAQMDHGFHPQITHTHLHQHHPSSCSCQAARQCDHACSAAFHQHAQAEA